MLRKERFKHFVDYFTQHYAEPETELAFANPYQLLVAVILSAQCTDKRVNITTPALFERFPTVYELAVSTTEEIYTYIRSISYPNNKAKHLLGMAQMLVKEFGGEVPATVEELQKLPGVGRKTAHVIASIVWNQPVMAVDTHVFRVSKRIGLADEDANTPLAVELQLTPHIPDPYISKAHHWLILHGRYICVARKPKCEICPLTHFCKFYEEVVSGNKSENNSF